MNPSIPSLKGTYNTSLLSDQLKHEEWILLQRTDGLRTDSRLYVCFQHLYSEEEYFNNLNGKWDSHIKAQQKKIAKNLADLEKLENPNDFLMTVAHGDFYIARLRPTQEMAAVEAIDPAYVDRVPPPTGNHPMGMLAALVGLVIIVMCLLMIAHRACFDSVWIVLLSR